MNEPLAPFFRTRINISIHWMLRDMGSRWSSVVINQQKQLAAEVMAMQKLQGGAR